MIGGHDISFMVGEKAAKKLFTPESRGKDCIEGDKGCVGQFKVSGLDIRDTAKLLNERRDETGTSAHLWYHLDNTTGRLAAGRLVESYLLARCPILLPVDPLVWSKPVHTDESTGLSTSNHCIVIVGMRREPMSISLPPSAAGSRGITAREIRELIYHNPSGEPFGKRPFKECLDAIPRSPAANNNGTSRKWLQMVFVADMMVDRHGSDCLATLLNMAAGDLSAFRQRYPDSECEADDIMQYLWHPENYTELVHREGAAGTMDLGVEQCSHSDYRVILLHAHDIIQTIAHPEYDANSLSKIVAAKKSDALSWMEWGARPAVAEIKKLAGWYWCVVGYTDGSVTALWAFSVNSNPGDYPKQGSDCHFWRKRS